MRSETEIQNRLEDLLAACADLETRITEEMRTPIKTDAVMAKVAFYSTQRKKTEAKIEELQWVLKPE